MKKDKLREYLFAIILLAIALFDFIVLNHKKSRYFIILILSIYTAVCTYLIRPKRVNAIQKKYVAIYVTVFSIIFIILLYLMGLFMGFYRNPYALGFKVLFQRIVPYVSLIVLSELIRKCFISKDSKVTKILVTISMIFIEMSIYNNLNGLNNLEDYLTFWGYIVMAATSVNLFCNYISKRYGMIPNLIYRIATMGYTYIFPLLPDVYLFFQTTLRIMYPFIMYLIIESGDASYASRSTDDRSSRFAIFPYVSLIFMCLFVMLVSCKFKYGIIAVGSGSMTGTVNKGDAIIYEKYENQELNENDIIVFMYDNKRVIHRIDGITKLKTKEVYYTKGDANQQSDEGYREKSDIIGVYKCKINSLGWPVVWLSENIG